MAWLTTIWLLGVFLESIVVYNRGVDVVAVVIALIGQLVVTIAWTLYRPLPLWLVCFWALIVLSAVLGLVITVPGGFVMSWLVVGLVPSGVAMLIAAWLATERSHSLVH